MDKSNPAFTPSPELLEARRGPIDGQKFFLRSPFRSGAFLFTTTICLVDVLLAFYISCEYWQKLSTFSAWAIWAVGLGLARAWWKACQYTNRVRNLYSEGYVTEVERGSPLDIALGVAAGATNEILSYSAGAIMVLLAFTIKLLNRVLVN